MLKTWKQQLAGVSLLLMARIGIIEYCEDHEHYQTARQFEPTNKGIEREIRPHYTSELHATLEPLSVAATGWVS
jgi:hypothetical protein